MTETVRLIPNPNPEAVYYGTRYWLNDLEDSDERHLFGSDTTQAIEDAQGNVIAYAHELNAKTFIYALYALQDHYEEEQ